jgi:glycosyltransferase involved in cell wall biosynthesis
LEEYRQKNPRVRYVVNEKNKGYNKNFEYAFSHARADHIAISDQDDIWELHKIETMMKNWLPDSLFIYSLSGNFSGDNFRERRPAPKVNYTHMDHPFQHVFGGLIHGHACMFKKELLSHCPPFPPDIFYDAWMALYAVSTGTIGCVPETLTWHRAHGKNSSRTLTSIKDKNERDQKLRHQQIYFLESFCHLGIGNPEANRLLLQFASILKTMDGKKFSRPMFRYVMKNKELIFHYKKKKPFIFFSYLKHAVQMAKKGLL